MVQTWRQPPARFKFCTVEKKLADKSLKKLGKGVASSGGCAGGEVEQKPFLSAFC
jgi:hypothetical protein